MATKPENVNPFAKYVEQSGEVAQDNPFAKFVTPSLDVEKLKAETKRYEEEVPFTQRITDPLKQGIAGLSSFIPGLEVSSIQKEINAIREGKRGPRDPMTGEQLPFQPEEQENAIKMLQEQQKQAQAKVMSSEAEAAKYQTRPAVAALSNVETAREAFQAFQTDPLGVMSSVSLQSLPQIVPALILGAVTRNPTVGALAMGSTSFAGELSSGVSEYFQDQGVNIKDPIEVNKALNDPVMFAKGYEYALTRASIIGAADTAAAGLASKLLVPKNLVKNQLAKEAVNIGVAQPVAQMLSGAGGEAAAQLATEGEVTKPGQVLLEAAGEGPSSVLETAAFGGKEAINRLKTAPTEAVPPEPSAAPAAPAAAVPSAIITEEDIDTGERLTPVSPTPPPAAPAAVAPAATPAAPVAATAEIAQRIEELDTEFKAIDAAYGTATPDQIGPMSARQGEIKSEISRLFQAGTTGAPIAPVEAVAPVPTEVAPAAPVQVPEAAAPVEVPVAVTPKEEFSMKALQFQNRFIDAEKSGKLTKEQSNIIFNLYNNNKVEEAEKRLNNILRRQEKLAPKAEEVVTAPPVEAPEPVEVAMSKNKRLTNFLSQDKNELIERFAKNNNISPEYAEKVYNAEKEYLENFARYGYGPNPDPDHESKFIAAQKKYDAFQNRLRSVREKAKEKKTVAKQPVQEMAEKYYKPLTEYGWSGTETYGAGFPIVSKSKFVADYGEAELKKLQDNGVVDVHPIEKGAQETTLEKLGYKDKLGSPTEFLWTTDLTISPETHNTPEYQKNYKAAFNKEYMGEYQEKNKEDYEEALSQFSSRKKPQKPAKEVKKTQAEINRERQAEKKAAAEKAKQPVDTSGVKDLIEGKTKKVLGWTVYKRKEDPEFWYVQSPENHAANRIGQGDDVSTNLDTARARIEQHIADAEYDARKVAEKPVEKKAEKPAEEPREVPKVEVKEIKEFPKETPVSKEYQAAINKSRKATKAFQSAQDGYRKRLINDEEFLAARKRYDEAMAEYDVAYTKEAEKPEPVKAAPKKTEPKKAASSEEEQLIQDAVLFAKAADRTNMEEERIREIVENARKQDPDTVITKLKGSVDNLKKQAQDNLIRKASEDYRDQIGKYPSKNADLINAVKGGALNIADKDYAEAFYRIYSINPSKIKKAETKDVVASQIVKFESGIFPPGEISKPDYVKAAIQFLQSPLTAKMPGKNQDKIDAEDIKDVVPLPIEKKIAVKNKSFEDQKNALQDIAAPDDEIRYYLRGVMVDKEKNRLVVTDGHRAAIINNANFTGAPETKPNLNIVTRDGKVIDGQFPDIDRVVPTKHLVKSDIINTKELGDYARGVQKAWRYVSSKYNPVMLKIGGKDFGFNSDYIVDMSNLFARMGYDTFQASINENGRLFATSPDNRVQQVVMAMREPSTPFSTYVPKKAKQITKKSETADIEKPADKPYYNDFTSNIDYNELFKRAKVSREDRIKEYAQTRAASRRALKKIAKYGSDIPMQRELNELLNKEEMLKAAVSINKPKRNSAADFMARATQEMANENLAPEVEAVIRQVYQKYPNILEGLRLSIRSRQADGRDAGNLNPYTRLVTLWKDSSGVDNPSTIRHELTHSLEQMMTPEARKAVVEAWARSFETAIKRNTDNKSQEFFNKVFDFLDNPSKESFDAATNVMPSYDFYQYMNPSEYWAVNAEKLMEAKLGTPWARFVSAVKKLLEALKSVFGVNNTFTVHKEFDNIINGKLERTKDKEMLVDYLFQGKVKLDFLNSIEDVNDLLDKHNRPDAPRKPSLSVRDAFMGGYDNTKETVKDVLTSPLIATNNMIGQADRALTYFRNKNIFFGYGLEEADRQRYGGQVRNAHKQAIASVAVVNALHSGNIATQVMTLGKLEFDPNIQMFVAKKSDKNMANVVREKAKLIEKLGFEAGNRVIQSYFEAKRSRSIVNEYLNREAAYEAAIEDGQNEEDARKDLANIERALEKVKMNDEAMDDFIALENKYPELKKMMENWTAVNQNMIDMMEFSGIISKQRAKSLRKIEDYVPWYRIMDDQEDVHSAPSPSKNARGFTNVAADKKFGPGKTERDIDDIVDNMIHNVLTITRNSARNYAANRIVMEYGDRYKDGDKAGKLRVFPKVEPDSEGVRFNILANGRRIIVRIGDPLVAESVIGMENIDIPMNGALAFMANTLRRSITTFPAFQVAQLFMDAPTAALVTGLKRPDKVWLGVFTSFLKNLYKDDPIVTKLRAAGIGGYQSSARTPEKEIQLDIGLIQGSWFSKAMKGLDRFGDASDYAQRRSVYLQTLKETKSTDFPKGDEMLALFQANNVIDFKKRGSGQIAQLVTRQVAFMNAYAQSIDVLAKGLAGTGLKGIDRKKAFGRMVVAGMMLASATIVYCMLVGDDDEYNKLDDQTKMRNIFIPGLNMRLPMHSGAAFFFKAIPELIYNTIVKSGTKDAYDEKRLYRALGKAAVDSLLGPNPTPTGVKPVIEIALNRNFFTGGQVTPRGMEDLAAFRQYNQNTSELGKIISALTGTEKSRLLNPIEADHLVRGLTGTVGAAVMWGSNLLAGDRPTPQAKDNPLYGQFVMPDVPRGREDLYYDLKSKTDEAYKTYMDLQKKQRKEEAAEWFKENKKLIQVYGYTSVIEADLKRINGEIRRMSDLPGEKMSPDAKRKRLTELQELKGRILKDVISMRKRAGFDD